MEQSMEKPRYVACPQPRGGWMVTNMNGNGRVHGIEIVETDLPTKADAEAWIAKASAA